MLCYRRGSWIRCQECVHNNKGYNQSKFPKGFWWWCITLGITDFLDFIHCLSILWEHSILETGSVSILRWKGAGAPIQLSPFRIFQQRTKSRNSMMTWVSDICNLLCYSHISSTTSVDSMSNYIRQTSDPSPWAIRESTGSSRTISL
jgi:hypothetical protein